MKKITGIRNCSVCPIEYCEVAERDENYDKFLEGDGVPANCPLEDDLLDDWQKLANDIREWSDAIFIGQTSLGKVKHLKKEVDELMGELRGSFLGDVDSLKMEFADCLMLLLDAANHVDIDTHLLYQAVRAKLEINKARTWPALNAEGFSEHIK